MSWVFVRLITGALVGSAGFGGGYLLGLWVHAPWAGSFFGMLCAVTLLTLKDALQAHRLIGWLSREPQRHQAPTQAGAWGELGYRTERALKKLTALAVQEKNRLSQFLSAIEAAPNGVLLLDAQEQIVWCNAVAASHFGLDPVRDLLQPVTNLIRAPEFVAYLQSGEFAEPMLMRDDLQGRGHLSILIRVYGEGLKLILSADVTELERTETMRRDFVANVSHEIRTPLSVVVGFVETLGELTLSQAQHRRVLELMRQQTQRMQTLVGDLLILAQLEGSPRPANDQWVAMDKLVDRVYCDALVLSQNRHQLSLACVCSAKLAGHESELLSAVSNLVNNAVRYTPAGGVITLGWLVRDDGAGEVFVQDSGMGIAKEHIPRLPERFYRVDSSRSRDTGGTGLGLSIVKHVVQRHGGSLQIQSELGHGAKFSLIFPAARVVV
jgi:two-component system, OmpR family, phosphate regulon sensor histidine kinase PhoR